MEFGVGVVDFTVRRDLTLMMMMMMTMMICATSRYVFKMSLTTSRERNGRSACQENPKFHNSPPLVPVRSQMNPVHINKSYFFKVNFNIIFAPRDPK
jgi:hypothetical protein